MLMEKTERETRDFMNVESFSQLPFIRPAPIKEKATGLKLFGIEFGSGETVSPAAVTNEESESAETATDAFDADIKDANSTENSESNRRFECHYCCRNFPTSQALGGHQNAHKRERQHAKRAHLQSAMAHSSFSESHVYGLMNYRLGSVSSPSMAYPSWNSSSSSPIASGHGRFYGSHHRGLYSSQQPISGSPLGMWRIPAVQSNPTFSRDRSLHPLPLLATEDLNIKASQVVGSAGSQNRYSSNYDSKPRVEDPVSLDLRL